MELAISKVLSSVHGMGLWSGRVSAFLMVETSEHERAFVTDSVTVGSWEQTWEHGMAALWESTSGIASVKNLAGVKVLAMV